MGGAAAARHAPSTRAAACSGAMLTHVLNPACLSRGWLDDLSPRRMPARWWLAPLFGGLIGGIIAAVVARRRGAGWWKFVVVGLVMGLVWFILIVNVVPAIIQAYEIRLVHRDFRDAGCDFIVDSPGLAGDTGFGRGCYVP